MERTCMVLLDENQRRLTQPMRAVSSFEALETASRLMADRPRPLLPQRECSDAGRRGFELKMSRLARAGGTVARLSTGADTRASGFGRYEKRDAQFYQHEDGDGGGHGAHCAYVVVGQDNNGRRIGEWTRRRPMFRQPRSFGRGAGKPVALR